MRGNKYIYTYMKHWSTKGCRFLSLSIFFLPNNPSILLPITSIFLLSSLPHFLPRISPSFPPHLSSLCFFPPYVSFLVPPSSSLPVTLTSSSSPSSSLQHLCPCGGGVPEKKKPPGQPGTSQMVSKLHLHYPSSPLPLFLRPVPHNDSLFLWHLTSVSSWPVCS